MCPSKDQKGSHGVRSGMIFETAVNQIFVSDQVQGTTLEIHVPWFATDSGGSPNLICAHYLYCVYVCVHAYIYVCVCACMFLYMHTLLCICLYIYIYACVYI